MLIYLTIGSAIAVTILTIIRFTIRSDGDLIEFLFMPMIAILCGISIPYMMSLLIAFPEYSFQTQQPYSYEEIVGDKFEFGSDYVKYIDEEGNPQQRESGIDMNKLVIENTEEEHSRLIIDTQIYPISGMTIHDCTLYLASDSDQLTEQQAEEDHSA